MKDYYGEQVVKSYTINFNKWKWAVDEGFGLEDLFNTNLYREVFKEIEPHNASSYLMG